MLELLKKYQKKPEDVFTPRAPDVNDSMYIPRPELENSLREEIRGNYHLIMHGESGSGKSWLYKKVLEDVDIYLITANLANASRLGSINNELANIVDREGKPTQKGYDESKEAGISTPLLGGSLSHTKNYTIGEKEPFERCLELLKREAKGEKAVLVFDNLETVFNNEDIMRELADIIILADDPLYSSYGVKILIVGIPKEIKRYFRDTPHRTSVSNRLVELPEVSRFTEDQSKLLVRKGFIEELHYKVEGGWDISAMEEYITWVTDRIPQRLQEYCLLLARVGFETETVTYDMRLKAENRWISQYLSSAYEIVEYHMNERNTKAGRKNQTLYALGRTEKNNFHISDIEAELRKEFPKTTSKINIYRILNGFAEEGRNRLLERSPKGSYYSFADPMYKMALRVMLRKDSETEKVERIDPSSPRLDLR